MLNLYAATDQEVTGDADDIILSIPKMQKLGNCIAYVVRAAGNGRAALGHLNTAPGFAMGGPGMNPLLLEFKHRVDALLMPNNVEISTVVVGGNWGEGMRGNEKWTMVLKPSILQVFPASTKHDVELMIFDVPLFEPGIAIIDGDMDHTPEATINWL
jgi:hypothetical protein